MKLIPSYSRQKKALEDVGDKIPEADKASVQADLAALKTLLDQTKDQEMTESQVADMKAAQEKLMQSAQTLFSKVYEQAQAAGGAAGARPRHGRCSRKRRLRTG